MSAVPEASLRYSISEAAVLLDRSPQTLRSWDRNHSMPVELRPKRDEQNNRYWTPELIEQIKKWIVDNHFHPGRGISYEPTPERLQQHINRIRHSSRKNDKEPAPLAALREVIEHARTELKVPEDRIVAMLPEVAAKEGIPLNEALRVASEVFARP